MLFYEKSEGRQAGSNLSEVRHRTLTLANAEIINILLLRLTVNGLLQVDVPNFRNLAYLISYDKN